MMARQDRKTDRIKPHQALFDICENYRRWLSDASLNSFDKLMFDDIGTVIKKGYAREIRRIDACGKIVYLKRRTTPQSSRTSFEMYLQGMRAHTIPYIEYLHVKALQRSGFPAMKVIAAGEQRRYGFPGCGFILLDEVKGTPFDLLLKNATDTEARDCLLRAYGRLLAKLHQHGFYAATRLKDLIATNQEDQPLVLIDRETRYPYPRRRSKHKAKRTLKNSFRRITRELPSFDQDQQRIVMQAYDHYGEHE